MNELQQNGFIIMSGPVPAERLSVLTAAYDAAMLAGEGSDFKIGSATTRLHDLVNRGPEFDEVYLHPPLLQMCDQVFPGSCRLSSLMGRTLRPHTLAQELHVDL